MKKLIFLLCAFWLAGCAFDPSEQWENEKIEYYKQLESSKDYYTLANETYTEFVYPSEKMASVIIPMWQSEEFGKAVISGVVSEQMSITNFKDSARLKEILRELNKRNSFASLQALECIEGMDDVLKSRIANGSLKILMFELPAHYNEKNVKMAAYNFSMEHLKEASHMPLFNSVVDYIYTNKSMVNIFKKDIQKIKITKAMLDNEKLKKILASDYSKFKDRMPQVCISIDKNDKLMGLDVCSALNSDERFILSRESKKSNVCVSLEKLAFDVQAPTVERRTVSINQVDVNLLKAALLMPRNAIYQFETVTRASGISYAYMITTSKNGNKYEDVIRRDYRQSSVSCENMRVQNVFGGVQAAHWWPNQQVENMCTGNSTPIYTYEEMKRAIANEIASNIIMILEKYEFIPKR